MMMEEKQLYGALSVYRERGAYLRRLEQFDKAKVAYDEALKGNPTDVRSLTGRSQVCVEAMLPTQALADAELALTLQPRSMSARNMQARALYNMTEFEHSMVVNHRGRLLRRQPPYFTEGFNQEVEIIQNCIGKNAGNVFLNMRPTFKALKTTSRIGNDGELKKGGRVSRIPKQDSEDHKRLTSMEIRKKRILSRVIAMKYLGPMAYDKFFLEKLVQDPRLKSANAVGNQKLDEIIKETLRSLSERQNMLHAQKPYYTQLGEKTSSKYQNKMKQAALSAEREIGAKTAEGLLRQIDKSLRERRIKDLMSLAERLQRFLDIKTHRTLPNKDTYVDRLYKAVGEGYLSQYRLSIKHSGQSTRRRIAFLMGLPAGRPSSFDSVLANYPYKFVDVKQATEKVLATLKICENSTMKCWLMYELAKLFCTQKNFSLSKYYAKLCQRQAQNIENVTWWLNGCFALMSGDMQQGNANEVRLLVKEAYEWSKNVPDALGVQEFMAKCAEVAGDLTAEDSRQAILKRQKQILKILEPEQKDETKVLFKRMSTVPEGRRFSVLPQKIEQATKPSERKSHRPHHRFSILPGPGKPLPSQPRSRVRGYQTFDL